MTEEEKTTITTLPPQTEEEQPILNIEIDETAQQPKKKKYHQSYSTDPNKPLTQKEIMFANKYIETQNGYQSAIFAGYAENSAMSTASRLIRKANVAKYIQAQREKLCKARIASAQEVMEYFTRVMKGEEKDQFGLDASLAERTKAAQELAKRTVDLDNRLKGQPDAVLQIQVDWGRDE